MIDYTRACVYRIMPQDCTYTCYVLTLKYRNRSAYRRDVIQVILVRLLTMSVYQLTCIQK